jgi:PilZ domain
MNNLRLIERIDASQPAAILLNGGKTVVPCVITDFSGDGAGLRVPRDSILPDAFDLHVETARITYRVQMCWRTEDRVGVAF